MALLPPEEFWSSPLPELGDPGIPGALGTIFRVLWAFAGVAMLLLVLFLCVLALAGVGFRLGGRNHHHRPPPVFTLASVVVLAVGTLLIFPISSIHSLSSPDRCSPDNSGNVATAGGQGAAVTMPPRLTQRAITGQAVSPEINVRALVLYDTVGSESGYEQPSAVELANLVSRFATWTAHSVSAYQAGEMDGYNAVLYLGTASTQLLPGAFLDDVLARRSHVMWLNDNIRQLRARDLAAWREQYGFTPGQFDPANIARVDYKGVALPRNPADRHDVMQIRIDDKAKATVLATAVRYDGSSLPWAVWAGNLIYVGQNPFNTTSLRDDYLVFSDLLFEVLAPNAPHRHRALLRLEDIGPTADPAKLRQVADYLNSRHVPFSFGVYPVYRDPNGVAHAGKDTTIRMADRPAVASAINYMISCGGTIIMHGYTHQYQNKANPNTGISGDDFEFYTAHIDQQDYAHLDGPVLNDSEAWATKRIDAGLNEFRAAGLPRPEIFEFPHYAASAADYVAVAKRFSYRYERALYFAGSLSGHPVKDAQKDWQFFPFVVRDVYGTIVVPENMDYFIAASYHHDQPHGVKDLIATARANLVVRDGVASFFYHPLLGLGELPKIVEGIQAAGYTFVRPWDLASSP